MPTEVKQNSKCSANGAGTQPGYKVGDTDVRPWGRYEVTAASGNSCAKRILVNPLSALSLQSHNHRSEQWTVLEGRLAAVVGDDIVFARAGDAAVKIPVGIPHAIVNLDKKPLVLKEVQTGECRETDIVRYRDPAGRPCVPDSAINKDLSLLKSRILYDALVTLLK